MHKIPYISNATCCGSQAIFSAYFKNVLDLKDFEIFTTVPFAITHKFSLTNRLLESFIDHDIGLERAYKNLNIEFQKQVFSIGSDSVDAINLLKKWCILNPVVIGPLNMDCLSYLFQSNLYFKMNHYLIVVGFDDSSFYISDTEGYALVKISKPELIDAWRGDRIIEGCGEFILQRLINTSEIKLNHDTWFNTLDYIIENYKLADKQNHGSGKALTQIYNMQHEINSNQSLKNRLTYDLPLRIQRNVLINRYSIIINQYINTSNSNSIAQEINNNMKIQNIEYSKVIGSILEKNKINFDCFINLAKYEDNLSSLFFNLKNEIL